MGCGWYFTRCSMILMGCSKGSKKSMDFSNHPQKINPTIREHENFHRKKMPQLGMVYRPSLLGFPHEFLILRQQNIMIFPYRIAVFQLKSHCILFLGNCGVFFSTFPGHPSWICQCHHFTTTHPRTCCS